MKKPSLAKLKQPPKVSLRGLTNGKHEGRISLAALKPKPLPSKKTKQDFYAGGLLYWDAQIVAGVDDVPFDGQTVRPVGTVNVSNGDQTYTFHNRHGSWMADMGGGRLAELAYIAAALGTNMSQVEMYEHVRDRFEAELKVKRILTVQQQRARIEEAQKKARARAKQPAKTGKITLKGLSK